MSPPPVSLIDQMTCHTVSGSNTFRNFNRTFASLVDDHLTKNLGIAVEINQAIVPRARHVDTAIREDDSIEIIHAIGGG